MPLARGRPVVPFAIWNPASWSKARRARFLDAWWELAPDSYQEYHRTYRGREVAMLDSYRQASGTFQTIARKANLIG